MTPTEFVTYCDAVGKPAAAVVGAFGAVYVWLQYRRAQAWKSADLAQALLARLDRDEELALACQALDWGVGPLLIPARYQALFLEKTLEHRVMEHDPAVMVEAMLPVLTAKALENPQALVYRYCFIKLFGYLDNVQQLIADRQVRAQDVADLAYWVGNIRAYPYAPAGMDEDAVFLPALEAWRFRNFRPLAECLAAIEARAASRLGTYFRPKRPGITPRGATP